MIHPTGVTALVKFKSHGNHDYTGMFRGADFGITRISETLSVVSKVDASTSAAFKFLRDGVDAGNFVTLHDFEGHPETRNFLRRDIDYNTHVD